MGGQSAQHDVASEILSIGPIQLGGSTDRQRPMNFV